MKNFHPQNTFYLPLPVAALNPFSNAAAKEINPHPQNSTLGVTSVRGWRQKIMFCGLKSFQPLRCALGANPLTLVN